jgi:hypothetical protein
MIAIILDKIIATYYTAVKHSIGDDMAMKGLINIKVPEEILEIFKKEAERQSNRFVKVTAAALQREALIEYLERHNLITRENKNE